MGLAVNSDEITGLLAAAAAASDDFVSFFFPNGKSVCDLVGADTVRRDSCAVSAVEMFNKIPAESILKRAK
jgi:hypothetical protein